MSARVRALLARLDLRDRVTLATALVLAGGLAVLSAATLLLLSSQLDHDVSSTLSERADAQLAAVAQAGGRTVVRPAADDLLDEQTWVFDVNGRTLRHPAAPAPVQESAAALATVAEPVERDVGEQVRLRAEPAYARDGGGRIGTVVVGVSLRPYERIEHLTLLAVAILDLCIVVFGALLARRAVGKALAPVAAMTAQAADWSEHDLDRRFDLGEPRDELTALSATLDGLLARISASVRREQRFSAELAHELRTPLAGVRGEAELALRTPDLAPDLSAALRQIVRGTDRMQGVIDALLSAARGIEGDGSVSDAAAAARAAVAAAAFVAERAGVRVELTEANRPLRVAAEQRLVERALAPLLDNAIRHARGHVAVRLRRDSGDVLVEIADDGAGFAPAASPEEPFAPGVSSSGGAGLGLPLARRIARSAGGDIVVAPADAATPGGLVTLRLPARG